MANFTKKAIEASFIKLLTERPLSQITVKDIVTDCGVNRNTFYYYFEDIPKLIETVVEETFFWTFITVVEEDAATIIQTYPTVENFGDCLEAVLDTALSKKKAVLHIYHSTNRDIYEMYLWKICDYAIEAYLSTVLRGHKIKENDLDIIKKYLSSLGFGIISNWLRSDMSDDIRSSFTRLMDIKKGMLKEMIERCEET